MTVILISLKINAEINFHHSGKMAGVQVLAGAVTFKMNNAASLLKTGNFLTLHEQVEHMLIATEESVILLTMTIYPTKET